MFSLKNVRYKNILEIDNLEIEGGKVTSIVGESGSGKTTLLRLLNKLISCDSGEVKYRGENIESVDSVELRRDVVMLPQIPSIFSGTVRDNLQIGLKFSEKPEADDSVLLSVLELVSFKKSLDEPSENLSGGEKQRLALGRVILLEPEVLLLDEPSSALDEETERIIIGKLVEYTKEQKKTLVMVTHSKKIAKNYSDNIVEIKNGRIAEEG